VGGAGRGAGLRAGTGASGTRLARDCSGGVRNAFGARARRAGRGRHDSSPVHSGRDASAGRRTPEKISPGPLGPGLTSRHIAAGSGEGWDPRDASFGPLAARGRGGAGPICGPEARPTRGAEAFIRRSAPGLGSGPSNLARGRQRVRSLFGCPSRPPLGGRCSRWCTGRFFKRSHPGGMPDDPQQPVHRGKRAFQPRLNIRAAARESNRGAIEGGEEAGGRL